MVLFLYSCWCNVVSCVGDMLCVWLMWLIFVSSRLCWFISVVWLIWLYMCVSVLVLCSCVSVGLLVLVCLMSSVVSVVVSFWFVMKFELCVVYDRLMCIYGSVGWLSSDFVSFRWFVLDVGFGIVF